MKTKPSQPIPTYLPTCGEVFHFLVTTMDLTSWGNAFHSPTVKRRNPTDVKELSDQIRDWAMEVDGRVPSRDQFEDFICAQVQTLPKANDVAFVLCSLWNIVLETHAACIRENSTYLDRAGTRAWYGRVLAPQALHLVWLLQKLLSRLDVSKGPVLTVRLEQLLADAWPVPGGCNHPLQLTCYTHYQKLSPQQGPDVDAKTLAAWKAGAERPSCAALGRRFAGTKDMLGLILNFGFAGLLEELVNMLRGCFRENEPAECRRLLLGQAGCLQEVDVIVNNEVARLPNISLADQVRFLSESLMQYQALLGRLPKGLSALDVRVAKFRVHEEYTTRFVVPLAPPITFRDFSARFEQLWKETNLKNPLSPTTHIEAELVQLRKQYPDWCETFAGPIATVEARMALRIEPPTEESLRNAIALYERGFMESRYRAGVFTAHTAREALGLGSLLYRHETGQGSIKPWIKKMLGWWDLLGLGTEYDHEQLEQRIELAESWFTDQLNPELRRRLKAAIPQLGLTHWNLGGLFSFSEKAENLQSTPVDRRQKRTMSETIVGREQTPLMEALDRRQQDRARELLRNGADLNFINSTGDTCLTKAFAAKDYEIVLEILRRVNDPIRRQTILRETNKQRISGLEQAISKGQVEILRELARWKQGRGEVIDMNVERIHGNTPLYYAINCLVFFRHADKHLRSAPFLAETTKQIIAELVKSEIEKGVLSCIKYLITELGVDLDIPHVGNNTALTCAVEFRLHDVAGLLLAGKANVNHRFQGGGTALMRAIQNDDYPTARLLLEYGANHRVFVEELGRPIYTMQMSEQMRQLLPSA